jgi:hypothetical protein
MRESCLRLDRRPRMVGIAVMVMEKAKKVFVG